MKRTLALTMIVKNEAHNLPRLFKNISGLFDWIYITDTGSTDGTLEYLKSQQAIYDVGCPISVFHFKWIKDFSAARNHNLCMIKEDYWMWLDADDEITNKDNFKAWKESSLGLADGWYAPYYYAFDDKGIPVCKFIRERAVKTSCKLEFQDPVHEAIDLTKVKIAQGVHSWHVSHRRTKEDAEKDKGRNLDILIKNKSILSNRMRFYLGKEYFDSGMYTEAIEELKEVVKKEELTIGDRILSYQYLINALVNTKNYVEAIQYGHLAIAMDPTRAEFYCFMADCYIQCNDLLKAMPYLGAAKYCVDKASSGMSHEFTSAICYDEHPKLNLAKIYYQMGLFDKAVEEVKDLEHPESKEIIATCYQHKKVLSVNDSALECTDIVFTTPPEGAYPWDEKIYHEKGLGGSETAAVEMAKWLRKLTKRRVIIFNPREDVYISESGVEYRPTQEVASYFNKWKPALHIAWRHNIKLTNAKTIVWCHDLVTMGGENYFNYDKILALSEWHKLFLMSNLAIPEDKILVTRNGITPEKFENLSESKQYGKVIWPNSPDRGLEVAIKIMDVVRESIPGAELHCFYGMENLPKYGLAEKAEMLKAMMATRPWIKYIGNVDQKRLAKEFASSEVWLYPATFIETFCISALESVLAKCWPVARQIGALNSTLKEFKESNMCDLVDIDVESEEDIKKWAALVVEAIEMKKYLDIRADVNKYSWESVAKEWVETFKI